MADLLEKLRAARSAPAPLTPTTPPDDDPLRQRMNAARARAGIQDPSLLPLVPGLTSPDPLTAALMTGGYAAPPPNFDPKLIDPFYKTATDLFRSRGLDMGNADFALPADANKWIQNYEIDLRQDPSTRDALEAVVANPDERARKWPDIRRAFQLLYTIQKAPAGPNETRLAFEDAYRTWWSSDLVDMEGKPLRQPTAPPPLNTDAALDLVQRYNYWHQGDRATPREGVEKSLAPLGGKDFATFWERHNRYFISRQRLERLTGRPVDRQAATHKILGDQRLDSFIHGANLAFPEQKDRFWWKSLIGESPTTIPTEANLHLLDLAPLSGPLRELGRDILTRQQTQAAAPEAPAINIHDPWTLAYAQMGKGNNPILSFTAPGAIQKALYSAEKLGDGVNALSLGMLYGGWEEGQRTLTAIGEESARILSPEHDPRAYHAANLALNGYRALAGLFDPKGTDSLAKYDSFIRDSFPTGDRIQETLNADKRLNGARFTELALKRMADLQTPGGGAIPGSTPLGAAYILGIHTQEMQALLGGLSNGFTDGSNLLLNALGAHTLWRAARGFGKLPLIEKFNRWSMLDKLLTEAGTFAEAGAAQRSDMFEAIRNGLTGLRPRDMAGVLMRLEDELKTPRGPLNPEIGASVLAQFSEAKQKLVGIQGRRFSGPARQVLLEGIAPVIDQLGNPLDIFWVLTGREGVGKRVIMSPRLSAAHAENLAALTKTMEEVSGTPWPRLLKKLPEIARNLPRITKALAEKFLATEAFEARRHALMDLLLPMGRTASAETDLTRIAIVNQVAQIDGTRVAHNASVGAAFERAKNLELNGGERPRPNAAQYKEVYRTVADWLGRGLFDPPSLTISRNLRNQFMATADDVISHFQGGGSAEAFAARYKVPVSDARLYQNYFNEWKVNPDKERILNHIRGLLAPSQPGRLVGPLTGTVNEFMKAKGGALFEILAGDEARTLKKGLREGSPESFSRLRTLAEDWLNRNSRPEFEFVPPRKNPRTGQLTRLEEKLKAVKKSELVDLTDDERALLNEYAETPLKKGAAEAVIRAQERDLQRLRSRLKEREKFLKDLNDTRNFYQDADPLSPDRLKNLPKPHAAFLKALEKEFDRPAWLLRDKGFVNLFEPLDPDTLPALGVLKSVRQELSKDGQIMREGKLRFGALDLGIAAVTNPKQLVWQLQVQRSLNTAIENDYRYEVQRITKILHKDRTPADMQRIYENAFFGIESDPEASMVLQRFRMDMLHDAYALGRITKERFQELSGNTHYFHGAFERKNLADLPPPRFQRPSRYAELRVSPYEFSFRIPEEYRRFPDGTVKGGHYVVWQNGRTMQYRDGFRDQLEAENWLAKTKEIPAGSEVAIHPPFLFSDKEAAGMVVDAGTSTLALADRMGLNNANYATARMISQTSYARAPQEMARLVENFDPEASMLTDAQGVDWHKIQDPRVPILFGKYVNEKMLQFLHHTNAGYGWYKEIWQNWQDKTKYFGARGRFMKTWKNELLPLENKLVTTLFPQVMAIPRDQQHWIQRFGSGISGALGVYGVGLNPAMHAQQLSSNLMWNLPLGGLNPFTPIGFLKTSKYMWEGARSRGNLENVLGDPLWRALHRHNAVEVSRLAHSNFMNEVYERNYSSVAGYEERIARATEAAAKAAAEGNTDLHAKRLEQLEHLKNEMQEAMPKKAGDWIGKITTATREGLAAFGAFSTGHGPAAEHVYASVGLFDDLSKYALLKFLTNDRGMSIEEAMPYVEGAMQHLHRVPVEVQNMSAALGGSKFVTFPWNQLKTLAWAGKNRPLFLAKYLGTIAAWNWGVVTSQHRNPEEELRAHAILNGYRDPSWASAIGYSIGRINMPYGGALVNPLFTIFDPRSSFAQGIAKLAVNTLGGGPSKEGPTTAGDHVLQTLASGMVGVGSKFYLGQPTLNLFNAMATQHDRHGNPLHDVWDVLGMTLRDTVAVYREGAELWNFATTPYKNVATGEDRSYIDHWLRRLFQKIPAADMNDAALLRAVMSAHLSNNPDKARALNEIAYHDRLPAMLQAAGAKKDDGTTDLEKGRAVFQEYAKNPMVGRTFLTPDGALKTSFTQKEIDEAVTNASVPDLIRGFTHYSLPDQISVYAKLLQVRPTLENSLRSKLTGLIDEKVKNSRAEMDYLVKHGLPVIQAWTTDTTLPDDARKQILSWYNDAETYARAAEINRAAPGTIPSLRGR